jgi:outer membrane protein
LRVFTLVALILSMFSMGMGQAAAETKIGVFNLSKITTNLPQAAKITKMLQKEFNPRNKKIVADKKKLDALVAKYKKDSATMSVETSTSLKGKIEKKERMIKRAYKLFQEDLKVRESEERDKLLKQVHKAIKTVATSEKFDLILMDGVVVLHHSNKIDINKKIVDMMIKQQ